MKTPSLITDAQLKRMSKRDLQAIWRRYTHPYVCWHPEDQRIILALIEEVFRARALAVHHARAVEDRSSLRQTLGRIKYRSRKPI